MSKQGSIGPWGPRAGHGTAELAARPRQTEIDLSSAAHLKLTGRDNAAVWSVKPTRSTISTPTRECSRHRSGGASSSGAAFQLLLPPLRLHNRQHSQAPRHLRVFIEDIVHVHHAHGARRRVLLRGLHEGRRRARQRRRSGPLVPVVAVSAAAAISCPCLKQS